MKGSPAFYGPTPEFLTVLAETGPMQRLKEIGMNCGCEYTRFPRFCRLGSYSRWLHSLGTARIVWHFTEDPVQSAAALFHDIATPTFAHSVDFLRGDSLRQEATEDGTAQMILESEEICGLLSQWEIPVDGVLDYHRYPIADNEAPRLSADRLEYTLGNLLNYKLRPLTPLRLYYHCLCVTENEDGEEEIAFSDAAAAIDFGFDALNCSRIYVSDEDRYAMQMLSELLGRAMKRGVLTECDLMGTEPQLIAKLLADPESKEEWKTFRGLRKMLREEAKAPEKQRRVVLAKKRCIDPLVRGQGRLSRICRPFAEELEAFRNADQSGWLCAK